MGESKRLPFSTVLVYLNYVTVLANVVIIITVLAFAFT